MEIKFHKGAAAGTWFLLSFDEQMGNIGAEVGSVVRWKGQDARYFEGAVQRALELFTLTLQDERWGERLRDVIRMRDVFCNAVGDDSNQGKLILEELDKELFTYALAARKDLTF